MKFEGSSRSDKKSRLSKFKPNDKKSGDTNEAKRCEKFKRKHFGQCKEEVACYKYGRPVHYAKECEYYGRVCFECREEEHLMKDCPKEKEAIKPNALPKTKTLQEIKITELHIRSLEYELAILHRE